MTSQAAPPEERQLLCNRAPTQTEGASEDLETCPLPASATEAAQPPAPAPQAELMEP